MAKTHLIDETAAFELFRAVAVQARKDLKHKGIKAQDKYTAKAFLEDMTHGDRQRHSFGQVVSISRR